jgi:hypothetical protein
MLSANNHFFIHNIQFAAASIPSPVAGAHLSFPGSFMNFSFEILFRSWQHRGTFLLRHYIQNGSRGDLSFYPVSVPWTFF